MGAGGPKGDRSGLSEKRGHRLAFVRHGERPARGRMLDVAYVHAEGHRHRRVEIGHGDGILCDMFADGVGLAVDIAALYTTAGQPPRKYTGMMPAPGGDGADLRGAAELRRHDHEGVRE